MLDEAKKVKKTAKIGDELIFPLETQDEYGRIAAQTAKQVILQKLREEERDSMYEEFAAKQGEIVSALVQRVEGRLVFLDLGRSIGILPPEEQVHGERYRANERIKALVLSVEKTPKGPSIRLSRSHPQLVKKLFEKEENRWKKPNIYAHLLVDRLKKNFGEDSRILDIGFGAGRHLVYFL